MNVLKTCPNCGNSLDESLFNFTSSLQRRRKRICRACESERNSTYYKSHKDKRIKDILGWREKNREQYLEYQRNYKKLKD